MKRLASSIEGKVVAITGSARGIGLATASALIEQGANVSIGDIDYQLAESVAGDLGPRARAFNLDVTDRSSFNSFLSETESEIGPLDVLINNAGIMPISRIIDEDDETSTKTLVVNLWGVINGMKLALPPMLERGHGQIINVSSMLGKVAVPGLAVYSASKYAVVGLTDAVRKEIDGSGVCLTLVLPTMVFTELSSGIKTGQGLRPITADDVASAVVASVVNKRRNVYVPRYMHAVDLALTLLPRRVTDYFRRMVNHDRALKNVDIESREKYLQRLYKKAQSDSLVK